MNIEYRKGFIKAEIMGDWLMLSRFLFRILINTGSFYGIGMLYPDVQLGSWQGLLLASLILAIINMLIRPILLLLALPINLITLGLFTLIINTWMVMLADKLVAGFRLPGFGVAFITALIIAVLNIILKPLLYKE